MWYSVRLRYLIFDYESCSIFDRCTNSDKMSIFCIYIIPKTLTALWQPDRLTDKQSQREYRALSHRLWYQNLFSYVINMQWSLNVDLNVNISDIQIPNMRPTSKLSYNVLTYLKGHKVVNVVSGTRSWRVSSYRILSSIKEEKRLFNRKYFAARVGINYVCKFYFPYVSLRYRFWRSVY